MNKGNNVPSWMESKIPGEISIRNISLKKASRLRVTCEYRFCLKVRKTAQNVSYNVCVCPRTGNQISGLSALVFVHTVVESVVQRCLQRHGGGVSAGRGRPMEPCVYVASACLKAHVLIQAMRHTPLITAFGRQAESGGSR